MLAALLLANAVLLALFLLGATAGREHGGGHVRLAVYGGCAAVSAVNALIVLAFLLGSGPSAPPELSLPIGLPWLPSRFRLDGLSAFILLIVNVVSGLAALYGVGYGRHEEEPARVLPFFPLFLAGMNLVPVADDAFTFLVAWEAMSVSSWLLVLSSHRRPETRRAAQVYLVMAAFGTMAMILTFGILAGAAGDYAFAAMRARDLSPLAAGVVLGGVLLGAGSKAGIVPLHAWLPLAHPAAPSHVSALMSGVMTKVAIYAMIRILFDLVHHVEWWWGLVVLALGAGTAVLGVLYAVVQRDIKTLLAYSTVENVGVIVCGIGLALAFEANGHGALAGLSLVAALFHAFNHSLYKSLLFLGAGAVLTATGHRDLERLGGLIHRLPTTAVACLIGSAAISALPPLNGFASEWLLFQAVLSGPLLNQWGLKLAVPVAGAMLALATALAAACFVRAFGIAFLGRPRSPEAAAAAEVGLSMRLPMMILGGACIVFGVLPVFVLSLLTPLVAGLLGTSPLASGGAGWLWLTPVADRASSYSGMVMLLAVGAMALLTLQVRRIASGRVRRSAAWDCGFPDPSPDTQYTASSFAQPIRRVFGAAAFRTREVVDMPEPGEIRPAHFSVTSRDLVWEWFYRPVVMAIGFVTGRTNKFQFMTIREYLAVMFAALVMLLIVVVVIR
ncbi:MAG: hydrogenase 4 subunit B [Alphaproteobacteria bacterium]